MTFPAGCILVACLVFLSVTVADETCVELSLASKEGDIRSANFPQEYYPNTCTVWVFPIEHGEVVTISFKYLDLPVNPETGACTTDYIEVGPVGTEQFICGQHVQHYTSPVTDQQVTLKFFTGNTPRGHGFELSYFIGPAHADQCGPDQFHCVKGKCIPRDWRCNGQRECEDISDEFMCYGAWPGSTTSHPATVTPTEAPSGECHHGLYHSQGNFTMPPPPFNMYDIRNCTWHIYKLFSGSYIHLVFDHFYFRDGDSIQVYDGSNEWAPSLGTFSKAGHLTTPRSLRSSGSHMFVKFVTTNHAQNVGGHWVVFSAEYHLEGHCEAAGETRCGHGDNMCYRHAQRCDGVWDCPSSGADEAGCYGCPADSYSCDIFGQRGSKCFLKENRCSGATECANGADEHNCNADMCSESRNLFLCANKHCILYDFICDGTNDCGDNSDEEGCRLGNSRKVIVAAVVGSLLCSLLLVLSLGCACKFYNMRNNHQRHGHQHHYRSPRPDTPLSRLQAEMFRRRAPPPPYHEAMLTSRPYDEAVREYLAQVQQAQSSAPAEQEGRAAEQVDSEDVGSNNGDRAVQNLINLMDFSDEQPSQHSSGLGEGPGRLEIRLTNSTSSDSDSDDDDEGENGEDADLAGDTFGHIEMTANFSRGRQASTHRLGADEDALLENISEDSSSATLSADGTDAVLSPTEESPKDLDQPQQEADTAGDRQEESDKDENSDADSVCILCLDEEYPTATDDGSDTRCLLQDM